MEDTCCLSLIFARKDLDRFNQVLKDELWDGRFWDEDEGDDRIVEAIIDAANNRWVAERQRLANAGLTFEGAHSHGVDYHEAVFACFEGEHIDLPAIEGTPAVPVGKDGVDQGRLEEVERYYIVMEKVEAYLASSREA